MKGVLGRRHPLIGAVCPSHAVIGGAVYDQGRLASLAEFLHSFAGVPHLVNDLFGDLLFVFYYGDHLINAILNLGVVPWPVGRHPTAKD